MERLFIVMLGFCCAVGVAQANGITASSKGIARGVASAPAAPLDVLYDQLDNLGANATNSQDFETANDGFDDQAADDFVVPAGATWTISGVDVAGQYYNGTGPADSFNVYFYADAGGLPGTLVDSRLAQPYTNDANAIIALSTAIVLTEGTYWISVQARQDYDPNGQWGWSDRTATNNSPSAWQNPGGGFGFCPAWTLKTACVTGADPDMAFRLNGTTGSVAGDPVIEVAPTSLSASQAADITTSQTLTIGNTGESDLNWSITEAMSSAQAIAKAAVPLANRQHASARLGEPRPAVSSGYRSASAAAPTGLDVLYDQYDNDTGIGLVSQDFETANDGFDNQGADDFVVPVGATWSVTQVDVAGAYFNGTGPADSFNVYFYADAGGLPGALVTSQTALAYTNDASAAIALATPVILTAGTYWVSVQARLDFTPNGEWGWEARSVQSNGPAAWQNPADGFGTGCATWGDLQTCLGNGPDFVFRLHGSMGSPSACSSPSDIPWVSVTPTSGTTAAGSSSDVTVTFDSAGLAPDTYSGVLCVASNDPVTALIEIPVSLEVTAALLPCSGGADEIFCDGFDGDPARMAGLFTERAGLLAYALPGSMTSELLAMRGVDLLSVYN